MKKDEK